MQECCKLKKVASYLFFNNATTEGNATYCVNLPHVTCPVDHFCFLFSYDGILHFRFGLLVPETK